VEEELELVLRTLLLVVATTVSASNYWYKNTLWQGCG